MFDSALPQIFEPVAAPTPRPPNVRLAVPGERPAIFKLLLGLHSENGMLPLSRERAWQKIGDMLSTPPSIIGVIDGENEPIAAIGLTVGQLWYTDFWLVDELWSYVRPDYRRSTYGKDLITFAKWYADGLGLPLSMGILSTDRTAAKIRLYERQLKLCGATFGHNLHLAGGPLALREKLHG